MAFPTTARLPAAPLSTLLLLLGSAEALYSQPPCSAGEVQGEIQGVTGYLCAPRCDAATYNCPSDAISMGSAQPTCMLQDVSQNALCALLCDVDAQCASGAQCKHVPQLGVGVCLFPVTFADWARGGAQTQKLAVGWPNRGSQRGPADFQITKTVSALQNLKTRYAIDDGDADLLTLRTLLNNMNSKQAALTSSAVAAAIPPGFTNPNSAPNGFPAAAFPANPANPSFAQNPNSNSNNNNNNNGLASSPMFHDVTQFEGYAAQGLPGLGREIHDTMWNVEHFEHRYAATNLLTGVLWVAFIYLAVGVFLGYQRGARGWEAVPHIGFWAEYPSLVNDGVKYSKILLGIDPPMDIDLTGGIPRGGMPPVMIRSGGAGAFDPL
mmetsp:Transcript_90578/g.198528  ORF Transcript_90578/g.198528 Transcript_90578/m.198528 type:complete len:380 (-) Transcript_90578:42-1181(-)